MKEQVEKELVEKDDKEGGERIDKVSDEKTREWRDPLMDPNTNEPRVFTFSRCTLADS